MKKKLTVLAIVLVVMVVTIPLVSMAAGCSHSIIKYVQFNSLYHSRICAQCGDGLTIESHYWVLNETLCSRCGFRPR